jgi:hypothetical protein
VSVNIQTVANIGDPLQPNTQGVQKRATTSYIRTKGGETSLMIFPYPAPSDATSGRFRPKKWAPFRQERGNRNERREPKRGGRTRLHTLAREWPLVQRMARSGTSNPSVLAETQAPTIEVRQCGELLTRISHKNASELIQRGWAIPRGARVVKYLELLPDAPWRPLSSAWHGGSRTTQRIRNQWGVVVGPPKAGLEHKPLPRV